MDVLAQLPAVTLSRGTSMADAFLARGVTTFAGACAMVRAWPYGANGRPDDPMAPFEESRGTCLTKHGVIATLAGELGLDVHKHVGFYRLTDAIITGAGDLLRTHGLSFVPSMHCFLVHGTHRVDLTHGNRTGKNTDLRDFDVVVRVGPWVSRAELQQLYAEHLPRYCAIEPGLAALPLSAVRELLQSCHALAGRRRCTPSVAPATLPAGRS